TSSRSHTTTNDQLLAQDTRCIDPDLETEDLHIVKNAADLSALISVEALYVHQVTKDAMP
ncbi:hypothetical protein, partial [Streptomyces cupreus]|uniref:hypothetical protein n=1 Tax=Streptomyces cupreus TaxID=2759956 RepID=UPI001C9049FC